jgi:cytochrome c2
VLPKKKGKVMEPMQADRTEQEKLVELTEKLSTHNATHGKNVVFWSCRKCHPRVDRTWSWELANLEKNGL